MNDSTTNDILDDCLNLISSLPLDTTHFNKQVKQLNRQLQTYNDKLKRAYKHVLCKHKTDKYMRCIKRYQEKARNVYNDRIKAFECLEDAIKRLKHDLQTRLYPLREELEIEIAAPVEEVKVVADTDSIYCVCKEKSHGDMVCCDAMGCPIGWFHFVCVGLTSAPRGVWFCEMCKKNKNKLEK